MKYYKLIYLIFTIVILQLTGCKKEYDDAGVTVQPAPEIEVLGANPYFLLKGLDYVDPGIYTVEYANGDTIEDLDYKVLGKVDANLEGTYTLTYEVKNINNVSYYAYRTVSVVDFTGYDVFEIPSGVYDGKRVGRAGGDVTITKIRAGIYSCSDLLAGYYDQYVGYGPEYAAPALLIINSDGSIRSELGYVNGWGTIIIENASFDSVTNTISYKMVMVDQSFSFNVTLTLK